MESGQEQPSVKKSWYVRMKTLSHPKDHEDNKATGQVIMGHYGDKEAKQLFEHSHSGASTCLPSTADGNHPALVLINRKGLVCTCVHEERVRRTAAAYGMVNTKVTALLAEGRLEGDVGTVDESLFRFMVADLVKALEIGSKENQEITNEELDVLMHFVPLDKDSTVASDERVLKSRLNLVLLLWFLARSDGQQWLQSLTGPNAHKVDLQEAMKAINGGQTVSSAEAHWIQEKFMSIPCDAQYEATKLELCFAYWYTCPEARRPGGLNRLQLLERIKLETRLWNGTFFFVLWVAVFILFAQALILAGSLEPCRGIKGNLETQLELDSTSEVTSLRGVYNFAKVFAGHIANFVPLSQTYFAGGHVWTIQDGRRAFSAPVILPSLMVPDPNPQDVPSARFLIGRGFTLQAWVNVRDGMAVPEGGWSILRKALPHVGDSTEALSCWNWHFPPALAFGGQDYGRAYSNMFGRFEEYILADAEYNVTETQKSTLHTLLVTTDNVTFMVNRQVLATHPLPRPVTDCESKEITLGDNGLTLASVRFFPRTLTESEVGQIFMAGTTWEDIGRVVTPQKMQAMSEVATTSKHSQDTTERAEETTKRAELSVWAATTVVAADVKRGTTTTPYYNKDHPITRIPADDVLGHPYWEIHGSTPVYTDKTSSNLAQGDQLPQPEVRTGFTITTWLKFEETGGGYLMAQSMPVFSSAEVAAGTYNDPKWIGWDNLCWGIWVGAGYTGFYTKTGIPGSDSDGPSFHVRDNQGPEAWRFRGKAYRHLAFTINPQDLQQTFKICIDGVCSGEDSIDSLTFAEQTHMGPPAASCMQTGTAQAYTSTYRDDIENLTRLYLNRRPRNDWHYTGWQALTKYYDRVLTAEEIRTQFQEEPDPSNSRQTFRQAYGCKRPREIQDDHAFRDSFGNNCYWYFQAKRTKDAVCSDPLVRAACPVACNHYEECWGEAGTSQNESHQIWRQQMEFRTRGENGTMCVATSTTPEKEAIVCALNAANTTRCQQLQAHPGVNLNCGSRDCTHFLEADGLTVAEINRSKLMECLGDTRWVPPSGPAGRFFPCRNIIELNMPECAWDDTGLATFAAAANRTGAWSITFWYESLTKGCSEPRVHLLDGSGQTFAFTGSGSATNVAFDIKRGSGWLPGCPQDPFVAYGHSEPALGGPAGNAFTGNTAEVLHGNEGAGKHLILFGRTEAGIHLTMDDFSNTQQTPKDGFTPIKGDSSFLRVINVGGNIRMSPWLLQPFFPSAGEIGHTRFSQQVNQDLRVGPMEPLQDQTTQKVVRSPVRYSQKTMMVAPPIITLKRAAATSCDPDEWVVRNMYQQSVEAQCRWPYECENYDVSTVYTCPSDMDADGKHFGHRPIEISGQDKMYMEFLASITDNAVIVREVNDPGSDETEVRKTSEFVDILTKEATIKALFYSVEFGIMSMLKIRFTTNKGRVTALNTITHSVAVKDGVQRKCIILLAICMICLCLLIGENLYGTYKVWKEKRHRDGHLIQRLKSSAGDACLAFGTFIFIGFQINRIVCSPEVMEDSLKSFLEFDWLGPLRGHQGVQEMHGLQESWQTLKRNFAGTLDDTQAQLFDADNTYVKLSTLLSIGLLVRMVYTTNAHPRMNLITQTLEGASSDLMHFLILFLLMFMGFGLVGTWMFGQKREDFMHLGSAMATLIDCILGPPGTLPVADRAYSETDFTYALLFHSLCFLFLLNFVLAIIVDAYTKVMDEVRKSVVEQDVFSDIWSVIRYRWKRWQHSFPSHDDLLVYLEGMDVESVHPDDLHGKIEYEGNEIFASKKAAQAFYDNYARYNFLTEDQKDNSELEMKDLGMINALTMHKIEMVHRALVEQKANVEFASIASGFPGRSTQGRSSWVSRQAAAWRVTDMGHV